MNNIRVPKWLKVTGITIGIIVLIIALLIAALWIFINSKMDKINYITNESQLSAEEVEKGQATNGETQASGEILPSIGDVLRPPVTEPSNPNVVDPSDPHSPSDPASTEGMPPVIKPSVPKEPDSPQGDIINIMMIGQDRRPGEGRCRSDSMILVTINKTTKTITMTSFMRDALVEIPGYSPYKLNHAYQYGGMSLLNKTLKHNFGVDVDGDIAVDFSQFKELIDKLGGVDITLTQKEAEHMNLGTNWGLKAGTYRLTGEQALTYSRLRYIDNDYKRAGRQREVLQSLLNRYMSLPPLEMISMLDFILPLVSTNMEKKEIIDLIWEIAPLLTSSKFDEQQIPAAGTFNGGYLDIGNNRRDWFQYYIDFDYNREILREIFDAD